MLLNVSTYFRTRHIDKLGGTLYPSNNTGGEVDIDDATRIGVNMTNKDIVRYNLTGDNPVVINEKIGFKDADSFAGPYYANCSPAIAISDPT